MAALPRRGRDIPLWAVHGIIVHGPHLDLVLSKFGVRSVAAKSFEAQVLTLVLRKRPSAGAVLTLPRPGSRQRWRRHPPGSSDVESVDVRGAKLTACATKLKHA